MNQEATVLFDSLTVESVADAAITLVIDAEREAHLSVAEADAEAAAMSERTRVAIRLLDERTERRIRAVRAAFEQRVVAAVAALDREGAMLGDGQPLTDIDLALVQSAVDTLAGTLTEATP
jgi:hypothetical protein